MNNESNDIVFPYGHFRSESALRTGVLLFQIVLPMLLILGTVGNVLSIIVLSRQSMRKTISSTYLLGLSVADLLVLYVCLMRDWIRYLKTDVRNVANWTCKLQYWLHYAFLDFSVWLLTSLTIERFISTFRPFSNNIICTKWSAKLVVISVLIVDLFVHSHFLFGMELQLVKQIDGSETYACGPASEEYETFFKYVWHYIDLALFSTIPFIILSLSNIYIIYRVVSNKRKMKLNSSSTTSPIRKSASAAGRKTPPTARKTSSMTKLLIIFIVTTAPICIYLVCRPYIVPKDIPADIQEQDPWYAFVKILMYMNNTVNFIMYCISGSKFRLELKRLFRGLAEHSHSVALSSRTTPRSS